MSASDAPWGQRVVSYSEAVKAAGLSGELGDELHSVWGHPDWAKTAYGAAPADRVVDAFRIVASSEENREAVVSARKLGGWRAAEDFVLSLLAGGAP